MNIHDCLERLLEKKDENQTCYIYIYKSTHTHYFGLNNFSMSDLAAEHKQQK